jgi:hypothetical protein
VAGRRVVDRDAIVAAVDLPTLADALLRARRGSPESPVWICPAPGHDPGSPFPADMSIFSTRRGGQRWACQNCGADGSAVDLVMTSQRLGFRDALEFLARRTGYDQAVPPREDAADSTPRPPVARTGIDAWVDRASTLLWEPFGSPVRDWLTTARGLPEDVLRTHRVGATSITSPGDSLATRRAVDGTRSSSAAAVLPVISKDRAVFAQLRLIEPPDGASPYVSAHIPDGHRLRYGLYRPPRRAHAEILVTEGIIDALSANAAGYRAAAVLAPGLADGEVAVHVARLKGPLVVAFDPDGAGEAAANRLTQLLWARGRRPAVLAEIGSDLNDSMTRARDWPRTLAAHVRQAVAGGPPDRVPER